MGGCRHSMSGSTHAAVLPDAVCAPGPPVMVLSYLVVGSVLLSPVSTRPSDGRRPSSAQLCGGLTLSCDPLAVVTRHIRARTMGKTSVCERASSVECPGDVSAVDACTPFAALCCCIGCEPLPPQQT